MVKGPVAPFEDPVEGGRGERGQDEPERHDEAGAAVAPQATTVVERRGPGFVPLVLGGLVAGAIGYAIPTFLSPPVPAFDEERVAALEARLDALPPAPPPADLSGLEAGQGDLASRLEALDERIAVLESAPAAEGEAPTRESQALAVLRSEVEALAPLREEVEALSSLPAEVEALAQRVDALPAPAPDLTDRVSSLESELAALEQETEAVEDDSERRAREAAINQLRIALDSGVPYSEPLAALGESVPLSLYDSAETGVPTQQALQDRFPEAARAALAEARLTEPAEGGIAGFIRRQTGARSLEPREGDDADAVLSRAEAALRAGDLDAALAELESLPPEAREAMADWIVAAQTRADAQAALQDFIGTE
jgi:hypothetical protein